MNSCGALLVGANDTHKQSILRLRSRRQSSPAHHHLASSSSDNNASNQQQQELVRQLSENIASTLATAAAPPPEAEAEPTIKNSIKSTPTTFQAGSTSSWQEPNDWTGNTDNIDNYNRTTTTTTTPCSKTIEFITAAVAHSGDNSSADRYTAGPQAANSSSSGSSGSGKTNNDYDTQLINDRLSSSGQSSDTNTNNNNNKLDSKLQAAIATTSHNYLEEPSAKKSPKGTRRVSFGTISPIIDTCTEFSAALHHHHQQHHSSYSGATTSTNSTNNTTSTTSTTSDYNQHHLHYLQHQLELQSDHHHSTQFSRLDSPLEAHDAEPTQQDYSSEQREELRHNSCDSLQSHSHITSSVSTTNQMHPVHFQKQSKPELEQSPEEAQNTQQMQQPQESRDTTTTTTSQTAPTPLAPLEAASQAASVASSASVATTVEQQQQQLQLSSSGNKLQQQDQQRQQRQQRSLSLARPDSPESTIHHHHHHHHHQQQPKPARAPRPLPPRPPRASLQYQELAAQTISQSIIRSSQQSGNQQQQPASVAAEALLLDHHHHQQQQPPGGFTCVKPTNVNLLGRAGSVRRHSVALSISSVSAGNTTCCTTTTPTTTTPTTTTTTQHNSTTTSTADNSTTMEEPQSTGDPGHTPKDGSVKKEKDKNWVESVMASAKTRQQEFAKLLEEHAQIVNEIKEAESTLNKRLSLCVSPTIQSKSNSREQLETSGEETLQDTATGVVAAVSSGSAGEQDSPHCL